MGENQAEEKLEKDMALGDALKEIMNLAEKYKFTPSDTILLGDRLLAFGEAVSLITDMGLYEEYVERVRKAIELINEAVMYGKKSI